jgi:hypothetical protein
LAIDEVHREEPALIGSEYRRRFEVGAHRNDVVAGLGVPGIGQRPP